MKKTILLLSFVFLLSSCVPRKAPVTVPEDNAQPPEAESSFEYIDISAEQALKLMQSNAQLVIIDVSPHYDKGHLPNSINYYVGDGSLDKAIPGLDKAKEYLVYCHVDSAAILGAQKLIDAGFTKVKRLVGNYSGWVAKGYPVEIMLKAVGNYQGEGRAVRSFYDGVFTNAVLADLTDPAEGKFYEGWLVKQTPELEFFSTGRMSKDADGKYELRYNAEENKSEYNQVVITEETLANGIDGIPEAHVLEGEF